MSDDDIQKLIFDTAVMLVSMVYDPEIPEGVKRVMQERIQILEEAMEQIY